MTRTASIAVTSLALAVVLTGAHVTAGTVSIANIVDAPQQYAGQQVTVIGTVSEQTAGYRGQSMYTLGDGPRRVTVISRADAPTAGARLEVTAKVGFRPPDEEFTWPPVLLETSRRPAP